MQSEPQNFKGTYPLAGDRIGPAWRECWRLLNRVTFMDGVELAERVSAVTAVQGKTVAGLLWRAEKAGILEKRLRRASGGRRRAFYRVIS